MARIVASLGKGEGLRIFGPASIRVARGLVGILGAELGEDEDFYVEEYRSYYVKALEDCELEISISEPGRIEAAHGGDEPYDEWVSLADRIIGSCKTPCRVVVMGPVESGKTSFTALLANRSLVRGIPTGVIDADVGQADIGPPGFVSLALPDSWVTWLRRLEPNYMRFVGSIEPSHAAGKIISAVSVLASRAEGEGSATAFIDTDGWVSGVNAIEYKLDLARSIDADWVVVLGDKSLYYTIKRALPANVAYAEGPRVRLIRSTEDRKNLRSANYKRFLEGIVREISLEKTPSNSVCLGQEEAPGTIREKVESVLGRVLRVSVYPGGLCVFLESRNKATGQSIQALQKVFQGLEVLVVSLDTAKGTLCSLEGLGGKEYPAMLVDLDPGSMIGTFKTRYTGEVKRVTFGRIRLGNDYREVGRGRIFL